MSEFDELWRELESKSLHNVWVHRALSVARIEGERREMTALRLAILLADHNQKLFDDLLKAKQREMV